MPIIRSSRLYLCCCRIWCVMPWLLVVGGQERGSRLCVRGEGSGWSTPRPGRFTPGKDPIPIVQEAGWAPRPVWTRAENLAPTGIRSPDRPARSESLYRLRHPGGTERVRTQLQLQCKCSSRAVAIGPASQNVCAARKCRHSTWLSRTGPQASVTSRVWDTSCEGAKADYRNQ